MTLAQACALIRTRLPGARLLGAGDTPIGRVHTDTRSLGAGDLFVALAGERFDAHDFLAQARAAGAVAVLAQRGVEAAGLPGIEAPDSLAALGALAAGWRAQFALPLVAVTGSNGKTTVTQMIAAVLRAWLGEAALATRGNFNNEIGVPLTLLRLLPEHRAAVVELGMNHPGEIARLAALAQPTVALVNNAQREHLEFMHTVEAVARENGSVLTALPADGTAVFPADDAFAPLWRELAGGRRCLTFSGCAGPSPQPSPQRGEGTQALQASVEKGAAMPTALADEGADVLAAQSTQEVTAPPVLLPLPLEEGWGEGQRVPRADIACTAARWQDGAWQVRIATPQGDFDTRLHIAGQHNVANALAATACALAVGAPLDAIARGLQDFRPVTGRSRALTVQQEGRAVTVVDDSYNANPDSVRAAIDVLAALPGPRLLVLGDMGEVGEQGPQFHAEAGAYARAAGIEHLYTLGALSTHTAQAGGPGARHFDDNMAALTTAVRAALPKLGSVLVKGSRFMKMEQVVQAIEQQEAAPCS
ncbi:UDP-N-acetylmuramoyl-tripeptide--D-alanyl-D-alanine ligase [Melaminivora jejuensis]|uniref:UDP-N-acetylmuramoyl-tripeptide--D-alanyl-D- alanine ligase n=1 Tax=Melaminivora jejuensis TaxID=1267217 RepID=UPI001E4FADA8|nr:Mur ligase family protein [Melaminivora jejuensis]UHJ66549.1 Mur ligase domain-containing protein [Melaminivora jejuensis]